MNPVLWAIMDLNKKILSQRLLQNQANMKNESLSQRGSELLKLLFFQINQNIL